jgi:hypothetical protein
MPKSKQQIDADYHANKKALGWLKPSFWIRKEADMDKIKAAIDYENNKAIGAIMNAKTDKGDLLK